MDELLIHLDLDSEICWEEVARKIFLYIFGFIADLEYEPGLYV